MKAVVLARGLGTRMQQKVADVSLNPDQAAMADRGMKAMIAMADGRPFLDYILSGLADAGVTEVGLVIGPERDAVRHRYLHEVVPSRLAVRFVIQERPLGTADAVLAAESFVAGGEFLVVNGDNLYPRTALESLGGLSGAGLIGYHRESLLALSNIDPDRIAKFALIWTDDDGRLVRIVEKPDPIEALASELVSMNSWRFTAGIFAACRTIGLSPRGERELQDAVSHAMTVFGERFQVVESSEGVLDLSSRADVASVARRLEGVTVSL